MHLARRTPRWKARNNFPLAAPHSPTQMAAIVEREIAMEFYYVFPGRWMPIDPELLTGKVYKHLAVTAEKAGWTGGALDEHPAPVTAWLSGPGGHHCFDPFIGLAAMAGATTKFKLLTYLAVLPYYNPFEFTKAVTTLDIMSEGRLMLGCGVGYMKGEFEAMGVDFEQRNALFDEVIKVFRMASAGEPVDYKGSYYEAKGVVVQPTSVQRPHPPIWLGGNSKLTRRRVAEFAQGWMPMPLRRGRGADHATPVLETLDDLKGLVSDFNEYVDKAGRKDKPGVLLSSGNLNINAPADEQRDEICALAKLGVTRFAISDPSHSPKAAEDFVIRYAEDVIRKL
jgi:probable F420-dependent oxidoreductase